jgi:hypothetical protein
MTLIRKILMKLLQIFLEKKAKILITNLKWWMMMTIKLIFWKKKRNQKIFQSFMSKTKNCKI